MQKTIISILGRPLSGKDTQAALLVRELPNAVAISTGEIIREVKAVGSAHRFWPTLGPHIETMDAGVLIPEAAIDRVFEMVAREKFDEGFDTIIVTAQPRMPKELEDFDRFAREEGVNAVFVSLNTSEPYMYAMLETRNHGRAYDENGKLTVREQEFVLHTEPVLQTLRTEGRLIDINAERPITEVARDIRLALTPYLRDPEASLPSPSRR